MTFGIDQPAPAIGTAPPPPIEDDIKREVIAKARASAQAEADLKLRDIRIAAALNYLEIAKTHGDQREWTSDHARQLRELIAIGDAAVAGDGDGVVPQGFGPVVRAELARAVIEAAGKATQGEGGT